MKRLVYADHAATTPLNRTAFDAMVPFLQEEFGNPGSVHGWAKAPLNRTAFDAMVPFLQEEFGNPGSVHGWAKAPHEAVEGARATMRKIPPCAGRADFDILLARCT